jgi:DNA-binding transcriptional ArsR family regulator
MNDVCRQIKEDFRRYDPVCARVLTLFQLISNRPRFRIVWMLVHGEFCVQDITKVVDAGKLSNISQQLKILTLAGVLQRRRDEQRILYSLRDRRLCKLVDFLKKNFVEDDPACSGPTSKENRS